MRGSLCGDGIRALPSRSTLGLEITHLGCLFLFITFVFIYSGLGSESTPPLLASSPHEACACDASRSFDLRALAQLSPRASDACERAEARAVMRGEERGG